MDKSKVASTFFLDYVEISIPPQLLNVRSSMTLLGE